MARVVGLPHGALKRDEQECANALDEHMDTLTWLSCLFVFADVLLQQDFHHSIVPTNKPHRLPSDIKLLLCAIVTWKLEPGGGTMEMVPPLMLLPT